MTRLARLRTLGQPCTEAGKSSPSRYTADPVLEEKLAILDFFWGEIVMRVRHIAARRQLTPAIVAFTMLACGVAVGAPITYVFDATLLEDYGTIGAGSAISGTLVVDSSAGVVSSIGIGHITAGSFVTEGGVINVFNDGLGGNVDAIAFQGLNTTGMLGGVAASSSTNLDLRGSNTVINSSAVPYDAFTLNKFTERTLQTTHPTVPTAATGIAAIGCIRRVGTTVRYSFDAVLTESYGSLPKDQVLHGELVIDDSTGTVNCISVKHPSAGHVETRSGPINIFNDGFGGNSDAMAYQGLAATGTLAGVPASTSIVVDLRGDNSVLSGSALETNVAVLNQFSQRTLLLTSPSNPLAVTGVATIGDFELSGTETPAGTDVQLAPTVTDSAGIPVENPPSIQLSFASVSASGTTRAEIVDADTSVVAPTGFKVGASKTYYDLSSSVAFTGSIEVCIGFDPADYFAATSLKLFHYNGSAWDDITTSLDLGTSTICGSTESLSPFGIFEPEGPIANPGQDQTTAEGHSVTLDGTGSINARFYEWQQLEGPPVQLDDALASLTHFVAPYISSEQETLTFQLTVSDGALDDSAIVSVVVDNVNNAPVADAGDPSTIKPGAVATLDGRSSFDPEGGELSFAWTQRSGPAVTLAQSNSATPKFTGPSAPVGTELIFELVVVDDALEPSAPSSVAVTVVENSAPVVSAGPDQTKEEGGVVTLQGQAVDSDGDGLTYLWQQLAGPPVSLSNNSTLTATFVAPLVPPGGDQLVFSLVATDDDPLNPRSSAPDQVAINISNINDPPKCELAAPSTASLWPPNHKLQRIELVNVVDTDAMFSNVRLTILSVTQDEPVQGGDNAADAYVQDQVDSDAVLLRAERLGSGNGRVYRVEFAASDGFEGCTGAVEVVVPHDRKSDAVDDGQNYNSTAAN